jgi:lipid-binding SYLF domain-containing protein
MFKASFIFGARFGRGVVVVRQPDGTWSNPIFISLFGGSFGAQAGAQATDLVLVFQTQKGLDRFLKGKGKTTLGVDVGAAAGPVGKRFEASTDLALKAEILSYSNSHGIFAGVSAEGGTLQIDDRSNQLYYQKPVSAPLILAVNSKMPVPRSTITLKQMLAEKTAWPERIVKGKRAVRGVIVEDEIPSYDDPDGIEIDGEIRQQPLPREPRGRSRVPGRGESRPGAEPEDLDDLDAIPAPASRTKKPGQAKSTRPNDEDLPEALPEKASRPRPRAKPAPGPSRPDEDEVPDLSAPGGL